MVTSDPKEMFLLQLAAINTDIRINNLEKTSHHAGSFKMSFNAHVFKMYILKNKNSITYATAIYIYVFKYVYICICM